MRNWTSFVVLLLTLVGVMAVASRKTEDDWLSRLKDEQAVVFARLDEEQRLLIEMKEQATKEQASRQGELNALREEVALLEAEVYTQQEKVKQVQADAAENKLNLQGLLDEAHRMREEATLKAYEDSRRLCEVLTGNRPALKPLCQKMSQEPDPEVLNVIQWLYKKATSKHHGNSHAITLQGLLAKLIVLWMAWFLVSWALLRPLFNKGTRRSPLRFRKSISSSKRNAD